MSVSPPGHWLLNRMVFLLNKTLEIINDRVFNSILNLLSDSNRFTGINTFMGGINVDNINSIYGNTTFNSEIIVNSNITSNNGIFIGNILNIDIIEKNIASNITLKNNIILNNNNIYDVDTLTGNNLNIDVIKATGINYLNTHGTYLQKFLKVINTTTQHVGYNIGDISGNITAVNDIFNQTQFFNLSQNPNTEIGHWITGIDLNILTCGHGSGILQQYQNFKLGITYKVTDSQVEWWQSSSGETFPYIHDNSFSLSNNNIDIYIKKISDSDVNVYLIARIIKINNSNDNKNQFSFAIFNSYTTDSNYLTSVQYVLDMTVTNSSKNAIITV